MKTTALIVTILLTTHVCWCQRPSQPIARPLPPINRPAVVSGEIVPAAPGNEPANEMQTNPAEMETNGLAPTNELAATNANEASNPELASAYALTNRLSVMAPAQVQGVLHVQVTLSSLQDVAASIDTQQSLLATIHQNPQVQKHVDQIGEHIIDLARGQVKPSRDSVDRLSMDLLRACSHARLARDHDLILAIVINLACNSERLSARDFDDAVNNGVLVLRANGVTPAICNSFGCDLRTIALELQPNLGI
jgi:hypothetical protein